MNELEVLEVMREALWVLITIATPLMLVALGVGLLISLFQALTQIQEMTLSFVPKIIAIFFSLMLFMPFMLEEMQVFAEQLYERITIIGKSDLE